MSRSRRSWSDEDRVRAIAIGTARGARAAEAETGIPAGTVRSWLARATPEALKAEAAVGAALEIERRTGVLSVDELGALQRQAADAVARALRAGKTTDAKNLTTTVAILDDKIAKRRDAERVDPGSLERTRDARDDVTSRLAAVLEAIHVRRVARFATLDVDELRRYRSALTDRIAQLTLARRFLTEEEVRRRRGATSLFARVEHPEDVPEPFRGAQWGLLPDRMNTWSAPNELPECALPPDPNKRAQGDPEDAKGAVVSLLQTAQTKLDLLERQGEKQVPVPAGDPDVPVPVQPSRWPRRRHLDGWRGPRRGYDTHLDNQGGM